MKLDNDLEICKLCNGTGKYNRLLKCHRCKGIGKEPFKFHKRPLTCYYCQNTGECDRCNGTKYQKKYRILGSKIKCKKCNGSGICSICKDAPNGGYYLVHYINYFAHQYVPRDGNRIKETNQRILELRNEYERLRINNSNIVRFEDFARYPPFNKIRQGIGLYDFKWETFCDNINSELDRYDKYLRQFENRNE
jgi:hypothetical protein